MNLLWFELYTEQGRYYTSYIITFFSYKINVKKGKIFSFGYLHNNEGSRLCILPIYLIYIILHLLDLCLILKKRVDDGESARRAAFEK